VDQNSSREEMVAGLARCLTKGEGGALHFDAGLLTDYRDAGLGIASGATVFLVLQEMLQFAAFLEAHPQGGTAVAPLFAAIRPLAEHLERLALTEGEVSGRRADGVKKLLAARSDGAKNAGGLAPRGAGGVGLRNKAK
jgi:hypothetical protein